jgi:protein-disulfide isomerase
MNIKVPIRVIDIGEHPEAIDQYNIRGVPTMIFRGKQLVGNKSVQEIKDWLDSID